MALTEIAMWCRRWPTVAGLPRATGEVCPLLRRSDWTGSNVQAIDVLLQRSLPGNALAFLVTPVWSVFHWRMVGQRTGWGIDLHRAWLPPWEKGCRRSIVEALDARESSCLRSCWL